MPTFNHIHLNSFSGKILDNKDSLICDEPCSGLDCVYRTVINRSYYAAYLYAKEWLEVKYSFRDYEWDCGKKVPRDGKSSHKLVWDEFESNSSIDDDIDKSEDSLSRVDIYNKLGALFLHRKDCDYKLDMGFVLTEQVAKDAISLTDKLFKTLIY